MEGQSIEEVLQDKVGRIERLEATSRSEAQSLAALRGEVSARRDDARLDKERLAQLESQLRELDLRRQTEASRHHEQLANLREELRGLERAQVRPAAANTKESPAGLEKQLQGWLDSELQRRLTPLQHQVSAKAEAEELRELEAQSQRSKEELAEVSRGLQSSLASAQEMMNSIKNELQQVRLPGVHQPKEVSPKTEARRDDKLEPLSWSPRVQDVARLAEELHQARSAAIHQTRMEVHRAEAMGALEAQVAALNLRVEDVFTRLNEVELGVDTTSRGGVALRLRFEQVQSSLELRVTSMAADLADVCNRQHALDRVQVRELSQDLRERLRR